MGSEVNGIGIGGLAALAEVIGTAAQDVQADTTAVVSQYAPEWEQDGIRSVAALLEGIQPDANAPIPPPTVWVLDSAGERLQLAMNGGVITLVAAPGRGKTNIAEGAACSIGYALAADRFDPRRTLGFYSAYSAAVVVDTEMEPEDLVPRWGRLLNYRLPNPEHHKHVAVFSHKLETRKMGRITGEQMLLAYLSKASQHRAAHGNGGGILLILDRLSDFVPSDNDEEASRRVWALLAEWAAVERSCVLVIQHQKRNSEEGNGWLYTIGQYKASASLYVEVKDGMRWIRATKARRGNADNVQIPYTFDEQLKMFVLANADDVPQPVTAGMAEKVATLRATFQGQRFKRADIRRVLGLEETAAREFCDVAVRARLLIEATTTSTAKNAAKLYELVDHKPMYDDDPPF